MSEIDETARLILMENPNMGFREFNAALLSECLGAVSRDASDMWGKYRGWDGRTSPTHDIETGKRRQRGEQR